MFFQTQRKYDVWFDHAWSEADSITFDIPADYILDNADVPAPVSMGMLGKYEVKASVVDGNRLVYSRGLSVGENGCGVLVSEYPGLKAAFDRIHEADAHLITLRQKETVSQ
jgi:hypothetical protein